MKRKLNRIFAVVVLAVFIISVTGLYFGVSWNHLSSLPSQSPSSAPSSKPTSAVQPTSGSKPGISTANSLEYTVSSTGASGAKATWTYYAKNVGKSNIMLRVEYTSTIGDNRVYVLNGATQQAWEQTNGLWTNLSGSWSNQISSWESSFSNYTEVLESSWSGFRDYSCTAPDGRAIAINNISVNPSLPDSLFQHG